MSGLTGEMLVNLVKADIPDNEKTERLEKMYDWLITHELEHAKFLIGTGFTFLLGLFFAHFKGEVNHYVSLAELALISSIIAIIVGFIYFWRIKTIQNDYPLNLYAYKKLAPIIKAIPSIFN
jgi:hypothetical protein